MTSSSASSAAAPTGQGSAHAGATAAVPAQRSWVRTGAPTDPQRTSDTLPDTD